MDKFVAFLRGVNIGGHKKVPMARLKEVLEGNGFRDVKTILASGNVVFWCDQANVPRVQEILEEAFGFEIYTLVFPFSEILDLVGSDPFRSVAVTPKTRLYVSLFPERPRSKLEIPYVSEDGCFQILKLSGRALFSVLTVEHPRSIDAMNILGKEFGKDMTTRNFNTINRIAQL